MIELNNLSFTYAGRSEPSLKNIDFSIEEGEFVLITGPTGCGKTTLLKCLMGIIPHESEGTMSGDILINNLNTKDVSLTSLATNIGLVQQNPDDQIFSLIVEDEVAFGPENLNLPIEDIEKKVTRALKQVGLTEYREKSIQNLSGGQKQRAVIASILAMEPSVLLLDEPASQLDPKGAEEILSVITRLNEEVNSTIILVEHRIHEVAPLADRIIIMVEGRVILDASTDEVFKEHIDLFYRLGLRLPETIELFHRLDLDGTPLTEDQAHMILGKNLSWANEFKRNDNPCQHVNYFACFEKTLGSNLVSLVYTEDNNYHCSSMTSQNDNHARQKPEKKECRHTKIEETPAIVLEDAWFAYDDENWIIEEINLEIKAGEIVALLGNNGSGKSTLLLNMCGIFKPGRGQVTVLGKNTRKVKPESLVGDVAVVFQDPGLMLFCDQVLHEVSFGPRNLKLRKSIIESNVQEATKAMTIQDLVCEPPQSLSNGQRLRVAVASILSMKPRILLLDEPTSGQDRRNIISLMSHIKELAANNTTTVFITHDLETALKYADRIIFMKNGRIAAKGSPNVLFSNWDLLKELSIKPTKCLSLSHRLGLAPCFNVDDLVKNIQAARSE